jgi:predicted nucleic acid-binding Zn ribbon protein
MSRRPVPLADAITGLRTRLAPATLLGEVQRVWAEAAGEGVARHSAPVSARAGVVTVGCDSAVWAAELAGMSTALVGRLNDCLPGTRTVTEVRFKVSAGEDPSAPQ